MADETTTPPATPPDPDAPRGASAPNSATPPDEVAALKARLDALTKENEAGRAAQTELATLKAQQEEAERAKLAEKGEFKTLAERQAGDLKVKDQRILRAEIRAAAIAEGLVDKDVAQLIPLDEGMMVNGEPDLPKIEAAVKAYKAQKPQLFKAPAAAATGAGGSPPPAQADATPFDFRKPMSRSEADKQFREATKRLRH